MKRVLIANRGEIAVRIIRACREMGIIPLAIYSEADRDALHVAQAEEAYLVGPPPPAESYLNKERILEAARSAQADAIHPGYGFLSENADFAAECEAAGFTFIGPSPEVIRHLGDKCAARSLAESLGVPTVPGYAGEDVSERRLLKEAKRLGLPLLLKAAGGGGGRGMRILTQMEELVEALAAARREARAAFGDDRLFLERYIPRSRHIEVQILGDSRGRVVALFERECSIQRRYQKIVEESPSPFVSSAFREKLHAAAVRIGEAVGYVGAGTVEFLVDVTEPSAPRFYFLEVNTRLQVEHPVTEAITGLDLVRLQLLVAQGHPLPFTQSEVKAFGHALEVRLYAENPAENFMACAGKLGYWGPPSGPGIRVDSAIESGSFISPYYDPLLAKIIAFGKTREEALARMQRALQETHVIGVQTNLAYLLDIVRHPAFVEGDLSTHFLQEHFAGWQESSYTPHEVLLALAAAWHALQTAPAPHLQAPHSLLDAHNPWRSLGPWRNA